MKGIADALDGGDPRRALLRDLASNHLTSGLEAMAGSGYGGEHWLASFALFARIVMASDS